MSDVTIGKILTGEHHRDAIHVAIAPVVAAESLSPGQEIGFIDDAKSHVGQSKNPLGIVDPFLTADVRRGQQFYLFLFPNTVTGMRHHWQHPAFGPVSPEDEKSASVKWLERAAERLGVSYEDLVAEWSPLANDDYINNGECIRDLWYDEFADDFWKHRKIVTGVDVDERKRGGFTCSC